MLNLIAGRIPHSCLSSPASARGPCAYFGSGSVRFAEESSGQSFAPSGGELRQLVGYVLQFDYHLPSLTVRETLMFHAHLRLADDVADTDKAAAVASVIQELGLGECAHVRVGSDDVKGLSGGEKRRLSVGIQLLANPSVCLLDEVSRCDLRIFVNTY